MKTGSPNENGFVIVVGVPLFGKERKVLEAEVLSLSSESGAI